jgi:hypothetical protein
MNDSAPLPIVLRPVETGANSSHCCVSTASTVPSPATSPIIGEAAFREAQAAGATHNPVRFVGPINFTLSANAIRYAETRRDLFGNMTDGLINITKAMDRVKNGDKMREIIWNQISADMDRTEKFTWEVFRQAHIDAYDQTGYVPIPWDWLWIAGARFSGMPVGKVVGPSLLAGHLIGQSAIRDGSASGADFSFMSVPF